MPKAMFTTTTHEQQLATHMEQFNTITTLFANANTVEDLNAISQKLLTLANQIQTLSVQYSSINP
jgi:hypothetical protein